MSIESTGVFLGGVFCCRCRRRCSGGNLFCSALFSCRALRVRKKMCGKGKVIFMIGDILCENVSGLVVGLLSFFSLSFFFLLLLLLWVM